MNNSFLNRSEIWREQPKLVQQQPPLLHARLRPGRLCRGDRQPRQGLLLPVLHVKGILLNKKINQLEKTLLCL